LNLETQNTLQAGGEITELEHCHQRHCPEHISKEGIFEIWAEVRDFQTEEEEKEEKGK